MTQDLKKGDVVHVRAVVTNSLDCDGDVAVHIQSSCGLVRREVSPRAIVYVEPRALQVGDKVTWGSKLTNWTIRAICENQAMISCGENSWRTIELADLERPVWTELRRSPKPTESGSGTTPRALQVGDIVECPSGVGRNIRINAILRDYAWTCGKFLIPGSTPGRVYPIVTLVRAESPKPRTRREQLTEAYPNLIDRIDEVAKEQGNAFKLDEPEESSAGEALNKVFTWGETTEGYYFWVKQAQQHGWPFR
jgi:hypothetical protein